MGKAGKIGHLKCHDCAMIAMDMPWISIWILFYLLQMITLQREKR
jgi:hypothetical protein